MAIIHGPDTFTVGSDANLVDYDSDYATVLGSAGRLEVLAASDQVHVTFNSNNQLAEWDGVDAPTGDYKVTLDIWHEDSSNKEWAWAAVRITATPNFYLFELDESTLTVYRYDSGSFTSVGSQGSVGTANQLNTVEITVTNETGPDRVEFVIDVDSGGEFTETDTSGSRLAAGLPGLGGYRSPGGVGSMSDNFLIEDLAAGGVTVTPAAVTAVASVVAPGVILGAVAVTPAEATAVGAVVAPTVVLGPVAITPAEATAVGAVVNPTVLAPVTVSPAEAAAVGANVDPTVILGAVTVSPAEATSVGAVVAPTVLTPVTLSGLVAASVGATAAPTVILGALVITPAEATAVGAVVDPTVILGGVAITPAEATAVGVTVDPTVQAGGVTVSPAAAAAIAAVVNPTVILGPLTITPAEATAVGVTVDPTVISGSGPVTVTPAAIDAVGATVDPTVILGGFAVTPAAATAVGAVVDPTVAAGAYNIVGHDQIPSRYSQAFYEKKPVTDVYLPPVSDVGVDFEMSIWTTTYGSITVKDSAGHTVTVLSPESKVGLISTNDPNRPWRVRFEDVER